MDFYKKISVVFLAISILCLVFCIASVVMLVKDNKGYENCKQVSTGTLSSCVTQETSNNTYYFGLYNFTYNNNSWNFLSPDYYTKMENVPESVLIKHNDFTSKEDMVATLKGSRSIAIPFIYGIIAFLSLMLFIMYHTNYRNEYLKSQIRVNDDADILA